ncbi:MAG: STAS domain-containing protein [Leptospirales bacterium]|nr:STAS domain-containing protein [Leptospirales bacterium]
MKRISNETYELIVLDGLIDQAESGELESILNGCVEENKINICIDMIDVKHICSSALGVLVATKRKIKDDDGDIKLVISSDKLLKLFETTMLNKIFEIYESRRECISNID